MIKAMEDENLDFVFGSRYLGGNVVDDDIFVTKIAIIFKTNFNFV